MLGQETTINASKALGPLALLDRHKVTGQIQDLSREYSLMVEPEALISDLTVGAQQRVEIIKALYRHADILILDEPTSVLTPQEADELFAIMRSLAKQGKSIIFITHKLREVLAVADRISVMRGGKMIGTVTPAGTTQEMLAEMMVGRKVILSISKDEAHPGKSVLEVDNLRVLDERKHMVVNGVSFQVREGEILGIAGVQGNGQTELTEVLTGLRRPVDGRTLILGHETTFYNPRKVFETGTSHIPEDRQKHGLVLSFPVRDNFILNTYYQKPFSHGIELDFDAIQHHAENLVNTFDVRTPSTETLASSLSGGNQQKIIVARELSRPIKLLIASQPTRGLDVGSIEFIHHRIVEARDKGVAVLLISAELDEIMSLSDRIAVMYKGQILDTLTARDATRERLGLLMAGVVKEGIHD
jgi:simple sugar transport system ATP-binding protein